MLTPSKELGVFVAHAMYEELEKIAKYRVMGKGPLASIAGIHELLDEVTPIQSRGFVGKQLDRVLDPNSPSNLRRNQIAKAEKALSDFKYQTKQDYKSGDPLARSNATAAAFEVQKLEERIKQMKKGQFTTGELPNRRLEKDPTAATGDIKKKSPKSDLGLLDRTSMLVGKAALGLGAVGAGGALAMNQMNQPQMPY